MAATAEAFRDALAQETGEVDLHMLKITSYHGVPASVRADVYKFLLGVSIPDIAQEEANAKARIEQFRSMQPDYIEPLKRLHGDIARYHPEIPLFADAQVRKVFEQVVSIYLAQTPQLRYSPLIVQLAGPFVYVYKTNAADIFFAFQALMDMLEFDHPKSDLSSRRISDFGNFFRMVLPDLYAHFEDEELEMREWAHSWINSLLAAELPMDCLLRLWDTYFSMADGFEFHPYVCLAILQHNKEDFEDCDHSELVYGLTHLQAMDMDKIIAQAHNLKQDIADRNIL